MTNNEPRVVEIDIQSEGIRFQVIGKVGIIAGKGFALTVDKTEIISINNSDSDGCVSVEVFLSSSSHYFDIPEDQIEPIYEFCEWEYLEDYPEYED